MMQEHHTHLTDCAKPPDCSSSAESPDPTAWTGFGSLRCWMLRVQKKFPSLLPNRGDFFLREVDPRFSATTGRGSVKICAIRGP